ncbi:MAG TPA: hypothetical protein PK024_07930 [Methanospirillum sp.]|uniref:hypothetical protein n=1 Tax=Methanospirillum sp. TaxID=45200 RepID=UPI002BD1A982|nr:hypothetical protein [Methanospirillum sp.]HOJ96745.1 hypothetical protein [Methanospirillum sp.]HOL42156.1 hypothetical protein [Methanospirillum sp.]
MAISGNTCLYIFRAAGKESFVFWIRVPDESLPYVRPGIKYTTRNLNIPGFQSGNLIINRRKHMLVL